MPGEKICWLLEPIAINPFIYRWITENHDLFIEVWTHDDEMLKLLPNAKFVPTGGCWLEPADVRIFPKSDLCSFLASNKDRTIGHKLRQHIRHILPSHIAQFGKKFREPTKTTALGKYAYSITVENSQRDTYFTEKLIDCFLTGTIPIYWGTHKVVEFFDSEGIIFFNNTNDLDDILKGISMSTYYEKLDAVKANFELAGKFIFPEEWGINKESPSTEFRMNGAAAKASNKT
jgi:hypothetical protein